MAVRIEEGTTDNGPRPLILVVDDERAIRELLVFLLEEEGFATAEAGNGRDALRIAAAQPPSLVISDFMMPYVDGYELVARFRGNPTLRSVPVILTSAAQRTRPVDVPLFRKPFDIDQLLAAIIANTEQPRVREGRVVASV